MRRTSRSLLHKLLNLSSTRLIEYIGLKSNQKRINGFQRGVECLMRHLLAVLLSFLLSISIIVTLFLLVFPSWKPASGTLEFEIAKAILQMGVVSVIGTVVSLLTFDYQQERKRLEYDEGLLK